MSAGGACGRLFGLLGWPVDHSLSPALHAAAFRQLGVDACYAAIGVREGELEAVLRAVGRSGGGNVTVPHKEAAAELLDGETPAVRRTGACNCFWEEDGELAGDNTDVGGFRGAIEAWPAARLREARVLLLGAGGGARAVVAACFGSGAGSVEVWNRTTERARSLVAEWNARVGTEGDEGGTALSVLERRGEASGPYDLVVNATSLGLSAGDPLPLDLESVRAAAAFDLVYGPGGTAWTKHARELGIPARDGFDMLVRQAGLSLRRWLDVEPPLEAMRRAGRSAAGRGS